MHLSFLIFIVSQIEYLPPQEFDGTVFDVIMVMKNIKKYNPCAKVFDMRNNMNRGIITRIVQ